MGLASARAARLAGLVAAGVRLAGWLARLVMVGSASSSLPAAWRPPGRYRRGPDPREFMGYLRRWCRLLGLSGRWKGSVACLYLAGFLGLLPGIK